MNTIRKSRRDLIAHITVSLRNDLSHLNVLVRTLRSRIHQLSRINHCVISVQEQRLDLPIAGRRITRSKVLKLELIVGSVVVQIDALLLTSQRVHQSTDVLQQNPVTRVASINLELGHRLLGVIVVVLDLNRTDPLTTIVVQSQNDVVGRAGRVIGSVSIVHIEGVGSSSHTRRSD